MKVAIDSNPLTSGHLVRGIGTYTDQLLKNLGHKVTGVDFSKEDLSGYDVLHFTDFSPFTLSLPLKKPHAKIVLTIYDLIPLLYPEHYPPGLLGRINYWLNKILINQTVDAIITISETSKKDICRFLGVNSKKVHVIALAPKSRPPSKGTKASLAAIARKYNLPLKFVLYVGDVNYNKNIPTLIQACIKAKLPLVMVGKQALQIESMDLTHPELIHLKPIIGLLHNSDSVLRLGFVDDIDLASIFQLALIYCQPSLYEGFGLPILEAMSMGCPVVAAKTQALVEVGADACVYADPHSVSDLAQKLIEVSSSSQIRTKLISAGKKVISQFSWEKTAQATFKIYEI